MIQADSNQRAPGGSQDSPVGMHRVGMELSVYWPGADAWYNATVVGHTVVGHQSAPPTLDGMEEQHLHVLEYESGTVSQVLHADSARSAVEK